MESTIQQHLSNNPTLSKIFSPSTTPSSRAQLWESMCSTGSHTVDAYSWACPDARALNILKRFAPLVEVGCGSNAYWGRCLAERGVDVKCYDVDVEGGGLLTNSRRKRGSGWPTVMVMGMARRMMGTISKPSKAALRFSLRKVMRTATSSSAFLTRT